MARPTNRYARAQARARYRKPKRRGSSLWWNVAIGVIVLLGIGGIVVSRASSNGASGSPAIGDHWHAQLDVFDCRAGGFLSPVPEFEATPEGTRTGLHTHGDGFMHIHPFTSADAGDNATVGTFLDNAGGFDASDGSWELWEGGTVENGDACGDGQPGVVRWSVNGEEQDGDPGDYKPDDGDRIVLAFIPEGQEVPPSQDLTQTQD
ncbi:MAG: hypothetical protein ACRDY4_08805 [Acidimicrobiia bacterium]